MPRFAWLATCALLLLSACAVQNPASPEAHQRLRYVPVYDESACVVPKNQGTSFNPNQVLDEDTVSSDFFGKKYNRAMLVGALTKSAVATGKYVSQLLNGRLFRIPRDEQPNQRLCPVFTDLTEAPDDLRNIWDVLSTSGDSNARLAGLYFENCARGARVDGCDDHTVVEPTILIDEGRDRWTLVHEMMHFNFDQSRKMDPGAPGDMALEDQANAAKATLLTAYTAYLSSRDQASLSTVQAQASWLVRQFYTTTLERTALEEVTVEGTLLDQYLDGKLLNVAPESARNALWYMGYSATAAQNRFDEVVFKSDRPSFAVSMNGLLEQIVDEAQVHGWNALKQAAQADVDYVQQLQDQTLDLIAKRRDLYERTVGPSANGNGYSGISGVAGDLIDQMSIAQKIDLQSHIDSLPGSRSFTRWKSR